MKNPLIIISVIAIGLGLASAAWLNKAEPIQLKAITWFGEQAKPLTEFELIDHNLQPFNNQTVKGKWHLLFFGYTSCPDICPDTLQMLSNMLEQINDKELQQQLQLTFVTVDPERDELEKLKTYVTYFNKDFISARGDIDQLKRLTDALGILHFIEKPTAGEAYDVAHSAALTLIDPQGRYTGVFSSPHDSANIAHDLTAIISN